MPIWCYCIIVALAIPGATWSTICVCKDIRNWRERKTKSGLLVASPLDAPVSDEKSESRETHLEENRASEKLSA